MTLIAEFKASAEFRQLSTSSVKAYRAYIKLIEDDFGDLLSFPKIISARSDDAAPKERA